MGDYSVPKEIRMLKPAGTTVKNIKGRFYVYEYKSTSVKIQLKDGSWKWKSKNEIGPCIGQITYTEGFVRNNNKMFDTGATVLEYGKYLFIKTYAAKTLNTLKNSFNTNEANQIFVVASIFVAERFQYMKRIQTIYTESVLALWFPDVKTGYDALSTLYYNLGRYGANAQQFQQQLINDSSGKIAFDGHVIACAASSGDLSAFGYKSKKLGSAQINWMAAYDIVNEKPLCNEMFNGADPDKTTFQQLFSKYEFKNTLFVVDRGFNTRANKELMSENGNTYIVPMISGRQDYESIYSILEFDEEVFFIYDKDGYSSMILYQEYTIEGSSARYIAYCDKTRQASELKEYMDKIKNKQNGYTEEGLSEYRKDFGLFMLETNDQNKSEEEIFCDYKSRWKIETFYDYIDNTIDFNALYQQNYCRTQGLSFIVQIAGMIFHDLKTAINDKGLSITDTMFSIKGIKLCKERGRFVVRNDNKVRRELCEKIDLKLENVNSPT